MMRSTAFRLVTIIVHLIGSLGYLNASTANISCLKANCVALPYAPTYAPPLQVRNVFAFVERMAVQHVRGYLINVSDTSFVSASVTISGNDGGGNFVSQTTPLALPAIFPGQRAPFEFLFSTPGPNSYPPLEPQYYVITRTSPQSYQPMTVVTSRTLTAGSIEATFRNDTHVLVRNVFRHERFCLWSAGKPAHRHGISSLCNRRFACAWCDDYLHLLPA